MTSDRYRQIIAMCSELTEQERIGIIRAIRPAGRRIDVDIIQWCGSNKTTWDAMRGRVRTFAMCRKRAELCVALTRFGYSSVEIGVALDRDHSSILYIVRDYYERMARQDAGERRPRRWLRATTEAT